MHDATTTRLAPLPTATAVTTMTPRTTAPATAPPTTALQTTALQTTTLSPAERLALLRQAGDFAQAGATIQAGLRYVDVSDGAARAYAAYTTALGRIIALGEPVGDDALTLEVMARVLAMDAGAIFFQVRPELAQRGRALGLRATPIGVEPHLTLSSFTLSGRRRQSIRTARRRASAEGIVVSEVQDPRVFDGLASPARGWERTRRRHRLRFLVPPLNHHLPSFTRTFVASRDGEPLGFVTFDALYRDGELRAYTPSVSRASTTFRQGLWYVLMSEAIAIFAAEGVPSLNLGLVPLARAALAADDARGLTALSLRWLLVFGAPIYALGGIELAKSRFDGVPVTSYLLHRDALPARALWGTLWRTWAGLPASS